MKKTKRFASLLLAMLMVISMIPSIPISADGSLITHSDGLMMNDNQGDGIILTKNAKPHLVGGVPDGTVDIVINALTTGSVTNSESVIPTDIVLVLDVSGSMDLTETLSSTTYTPVYGTAYQSGYITSRTYYGFRTTNANYCIQLQDGTYQAVSRSSADDNNFYYYRYRSGGSYYNPTYTYVYPELDASVTNPNRTESYDVVQFYEETTTSTTTDKKITQLKNAVSDFIDAALESNAAITNDADKHRISIVKFADNSYYNGSGSTQDVNAAVNGNDKNDSGYNYTQIVTDLTTVNASGAAALKSAVNSLDPDGATAIDFGMTLAEHALFDDRTAEDIAGRHEIVVLFTDGSPTHSSGYEDDVAADAVNAAYALKSAGVEVYTISVAAEADDDALGTDLTNQFCHYVSSNYPDAQASGNTITPGEGSPANGYYWVPDDVLTLSAIFETVMSQIGTPKIELGEEASVIDTVAPYFTIPNGTNSISLSTADKTADGWAAEVPSGLTPIVSGNTLHVEGFDFDANYISDTPRDGNFYGRMLVIRINVTPDYDVIDSRTAEIAANDGYVNTNLGTASMVDSAQNNVAVVNSPEILLNTVTYMLDGQVYATYYRLPGADVTVLPKHADSDTHTYSDWTTTDVTVTNREFTMPSGNVVLSASSTAIDYTVSYEYKGTVPSGAPALPAAATYNAGDTVTVAAIPEVPGYVFQYWAVDTSSVVIEQGQFTMPARNVVLIGSFIPKSTVAYKVEHYLQNTDGTYPTEPTNFHYHYDGTTGEKVTAIIMDYPQFTYDDSISTRSGIVLGDGSLVLKLYYARNIYTVTYEYDYDDPTQIPAGAPALPAPSDHRAGETVTLEAVPTLEGYTFVGWASYRSDVIITDGKILMPDHDVILHGFFLANGDTKYKVEHYLETDTEGDYAFFEFTEHKGETGAYVVGEPRNYEGYTYNATESAATATGHILGNGELILKLYYDKTPYTVSYQFTGDTPEGGFPTLPETKVYHMGNTVTVEAVPTLSGYTFTGWTAGNVTVENGMFTMPDQNVVFTGFFSKNEAPYTVSHYFQLPDGTWGDPQLSYKIDSHENDSVSAEYLTVDGFEAYEAHPNTVKSGIVLIDGSLELRFYYTRKAYTVKYEYEGVKPAGASVLPETAEKLHGVTVDVAADAIAPGYTFSGWSSEEVEFENGKFTMPQANVIIKGSFKANTNTPYKVEHYKQKLDGSYGDTPDDVVTGKGTTGYSVTAELNHYEGFTPVSTNVLTGVITPEPDTLVIKLYYERNSYNVYYRYFGVQPEGAPDISINNLAKVPYGTELRFAAKPTLTNHTFEGWTSPQVSVNTNTFIMPAMDVIILGRFVENAKLTVSYEYNGEVPAGAPQLPETTLHHPKDNVTVAAAPTLPGYTFSGWASEQVAPENIVGGKFDMPEINVVFKGSFTANSGTVYKVEHYKQNLDGTYPESASETENLAGKTGDTATAVAKTYEGFTEDSTYADRIPTGTIAADGSLVLKLYYKRNSYKVTYAYTGTIPTGASALPAEKTYKYGEEVTVASKATANGYNFFGWSSSQVTPVDGKFTMPSKDVVLTGYFETAATTGYLVIDKELSAPTGFTGDDVFNFKIYRVTKNGNRYVKTVSVKAGLAEVVELVPDTYYIIEENAEVSGYAHSVVCDHANNKATVKLSQVTRIKFKNVYVKVQLEKDDHFGYIIGYPDGTVRPENYITRAEIATIFFRMLTDDSRANVWSQSNSFSDVSSSDWFNNAVSTLENAGVISGYSDNTFRPNEFITRAELVKIAVSFYGTTAGKDTHFSDTSAHWANAFIEAAREMGFVDGYTDGTFRPDDYVTRAEAMKIINRTLDRVPHKNHLLSDMIVWSDNKNRSKWYYAEVQEATNSHVYIWDDLHEIWVRILDVRDWAALEKTWSDAYDG